MKWGSHKAITEKVFEEINSQNIYDQYRRILMESCIQPDIFDKNNRHHGGREDTIKNYILESRKCFLQNDYSETFRNLGYALHYIQDNWTLIPGRAKIHDQWEQWINESYFSNDSYLIKKIQEYSDHYEMYIRFLETLSKNISYKNDTLDVATWMEYRKSKPWIDFNFAYRVSSVVGNSVFQEKTNSEIQLMIDNLFQSSYEKLSVIESQELDKINFLNYRIIERESKEINWYDIINKIYSFYLSQKYNYIIRNYMKNNHFNKEIKKYRKKVGDIKKTHLDWYDLRFNKLTYDHISTRRKPINK